MEINDPLYGEFCCDHDEEMQDHECDVIFMGWMSLPLEGQELG